MTRHGRGSLSVCISPTGGRELWLCRGRPPEGTRPVSERTALSELRRAVLSGYVSLSKLHTASQSFPSVILPRSEREIWSRVSDALCRGELVIVELERPRRQYTHDQYSPASEPAEEPVPEAVDEPDHRSLLISRCDPELLEGPLTFTYLMRGLEGRPCKLRIVSDSFVNQVIHERELAPDETTDGPHDAEWDGVVTADGHGRGERLSPAYSPARVTIVHDDIYRDQAPFIISARVHIVELEDVVFATGRAILLPDGGAEATGEAAKRTGLAAVAAVLQHAAFNDEQTLTIFGHTDTVGSESSNLELSEHRALNALHVVTGDVDAWVAHCDEHFDVSDYQRVLAWMARTRGWDTDPGQVDGKFGPVTRTARANFRDQMNAEFGTNLQQGTKQGPDDWNAYFMLYDEELLRVLAWSPDDLQRVRRQLKLSEPPGVGCGEAYPAQSGGQNNLPSAANRRVDFVFFDPEDIPILPGDPPGHELYGTRAYRAKYLPFGPSVVTVPIKVRLTCKREPLCGVDYIIERAGAVFAEGVTDSDGHVLAEVPKGAQDLALRVPAHGVVYALDLGGLDPLASVAGVQERLANLGYPCSRGGLMDEQTVEALRAFQHEQGLEVTGEIDDDTLGRLRREHRS